MTSWATYKGLMVPDSTTGDAGGNLKSDLTTLADRGRPYNAIINPNFDFWQRGLTVGSVADGTYTADRWKYGKNGTMVHAVLFGTQVPTFAQSNVVSALSLRVTCTTAQASIGAGNYALISQIIEGNIFRAVAQRAMTLSFWVMATKTGTYCVSFRNSGNDRSYVAEYTIAAATTWQQVSITVPASPSAGTWDYGWAAGLTVSWAQAVGTTYQTTAGSWQTGNYLGTSNQVNACDSTSEIFWLSQVQLEVGSSTTNFEPRTFQQELALCQRYFHKTFSIFTAPANNAGYAGAVSILMPSGALNLYTNYRYPITMRTTPTFTFYNPGSGAAAQWKNEANTIATTGISAASNANELGASISSANAPGLDRYLIHLTADAEL